MRRFAHFASVLLVLFPLAGGLAAGAAGGAVRAPSAGVGRGPALTWHGTTYQAAANQSDFGDEPNCSDNPCDRFEIRIAVPGNYWRTRAGGLVVRIDGFDQNQDYDLWVWDGGTWQISGRTAGRADEVFISRPLGVIPVIVIPYQAVASSYRGTAYLTVHSVRPPSLRPTRGVVPRRVTPSGWSRFRPSLAMNPLNSNQLVATAAGPEGFFFDATLPWIGSSSDGGKTWRASSSVPIEANHGIFQIDPTASSFDDEGNVYIVADSWWVDFGPVFHSAYAQTSVRLLRSSNGGRTWQAAGTVASVPGEAARAASVSQPWIAVDNSGPNRDGKTGSISVCWMQWNGTPHTTTWELYPFVAGSPLEEAAFLRAPRGRSVEVMYAASLDGGTTWSPPQPVSGQQKLWLDGPVSLQPGGGSYPASCRVAAGPAGEAYVSWIDLVTREVKVAAAPRAGAPFLPAVSVSTAISARELIDGGISVPPIPTIAVSNNGAVHVAWMDMRNGHGDVFLSRSSDAGRTWTAAARVTNDPQRGGKDQFMPVLSVTPSGQLNVLFYDRRNDRGNHFVDVFLARSSDGVHWRNIRVSSVMTDAAPTFPFGFLESDFGWIGEFQGMVADDRNAVALWTQRAGTSWQLWSSRIPNTGGYR